MAVDAGLVSYRRLDTQSLSPMMHLTGRKTRYLSLRLGCSVMFRVKQIPEGKSSTVKKNL